MNSRSVLLQFLFFVCWSRCSRKHSPFLLAGGFFLFCLFVVVFFFFSCMSSFHLSLPNYWRALEEKLQSQFPGKQSGFFLLWSRPHGWLQFTSPGGRAGVWMRLLIYRLGCPPPGRGPAGVSHPFYTPKLPNEPPH